MTSLIMTLARERGNPLYQMSVETDDPASLRVSEGAALSIVLVEASLSARGLKALGSHARMLSMAFWRMAHQATRSSRVSAERRCRTVVKPDLQGHDVQFRLLVAL